MSNNHLPKDRSTIIQTGIIVLIIVSIGFSGYMINQALDISTQAKHRADTIEKTLNSFIERWDKRIDISNKNNNLTKDRQIALQENMSIILDQQIINEKDIINSEKNILGNLTSHRLVANHTNDLVRETLEQQLRNEKALHEDNLKAIEGLRQLGANITVPTNGFKENKTNEVDIQTQLKNLLENLNKSQ